MVWCGVVWLWVWLHVRSVQVLQLYLFCVACSIIRSRAAHVQDSGRPDLVCGWLSHTQVAARFIVHVCLSAGISAAGTGRGLFAELAGACREGCVLARRHCVDVCMCM